MRDALLTIHILAAAGFVGGGVYTLAALPGNVREMGVAKALARDEAVGNKFFSVAVGLLLLSGIGLVLDSDVFGWGDAFVWVGIGAIVLDGAIEGAFFGPASKRIAQQDDPSPSALFRVMWQAGAIHIALLVFAVYAMVAKLGV